MKSGQEEKHYEMQPRLLGMGLTAGQAGASTLCSDWDFAGLFRGAAGLRPRSGLLLSWGEHSGTHRSPGSGCGAGAQGQAWKQH